MWGFFGMFVLWPLFCVLFGYPLLWIAGKFTTRTDWGRTTQPNKWDDRPPPRWHSVAHGLFVILAFVAGWLSLPLALSLTAGR